VKAGKSSMKSADRHMQSSSDATRPADMDSCMIVNDETLVADQSAATDRSQHTAAKSSVVGSTDRGIVTDSASATAVVENVDITETTAKQTSHLFALVGADSPVAQVS